MLQIEEVGQPQAWSRAASSETGALVEFYGLVRGQEAGAPIVAIDYEAYPAMAERVMREKLHALGQRHPVQAARVVHRLGRIPVGAAAIYVGLRSRHRREGFLLLQEFMDELKRDVPIWKVAAIAAPPTSAEPAESTGRALSP